MPRLLGTPYVKSIHLLTLMFLLVGCVSIERELPQPAGPLVLDEERPFLDVPLPLGFERRSGYGFLQFKERRGVLAYRGSFPPEMVREFYEQMLPVSNWRRIREVVLGEEVRRIYHRRDELLVLIDRPIEGGTELVMELNIYNEQ